MKLGKPLYLLQFFFLAGFTLVSCSKQEPIRVVSQPLIIEEGADSGDEQSDPVEKPTAKPIAEVEVKEEVLYVPSEMTKALAESTVAVAGDAIVKRNIEKKPEFYILYFTAEWSGNCKETIDDVIARYQSEIQPDPRIEMIMVSLDETEWFAKWAKQKQFPWPMIMKEQKVNVPFVKKLEDKIVPLFLLLNKDGKQLNAYTLEQCIAYAKKEN